MRETVILFAAAVTTTALSVTFLVALAYLLDMLQSRLTGKRILGPLLRHR